MSRPRDSYATGSSWRNSVKSILFSPQDTNNQLGTALDVNELNTGRPPSFYPEIERGTNNQGAPPEPVKNNNTLKIIVLLVFLAMIGTGVALIVVFVGRR